MSKYSEDQHLFIFYNSWIARLIEQFHSFIYSLSISGNLALNRKFSQLTTL